ncbi:MAG: chaperone protein HtpG [Porticoccaceae bacterium]|nr:MAG: chaperone protein HtpG [Porticoccaceae bacterium]
MTAAVASERFEFQTDARQILHLVIHSLYSDRAVFLRELVANAADAWDRLRFAALDRPELLAADAEPAIRISYDRAARTLTVSDNGIGMSRQEAIDNLGTIARSGTGRFLRSLTGDRRRDAQLIGQFGVGFYSAFMVADRVVVESRRADAPPEEGVRWASEGRDAFTVETIARDERGTRVTLHLRDDALEFLDRERLVAIVRRYADHLGVPIYLPGREAGSWEQVNDATALWLKPKGTLADEDYKRFYRHLTRDPVDPLAWAHHRVEGKVEYTSLLYLPASPRFDLYLRDRVPGLRLYVQRTLVMERAEQFLPLYLRFVEGLVDTPDLPLNVSRELLQDAQAVAAIRAALTRRVLDLLEGLASDRPDDYAVFWRHFGSVLKEGIAEDPANRERIARLLRFHSTRDAADAPRVSLDDYLARAPADAPIYYLLADNLAAARRSPYLEAFRSRDQEVLLLTDRIDEWLMAHLTEYRGRRLRNVARGELELGEGVGEGARADVEPLLATLRQLLAGRVADVRASSRLVDSPACLVLEEGALGAQLRRLVEAAGHTPPPSRPVLEVNPGHPLVAAVNRAAGAEREDLAAVILGQAQIAAGEPLEDPAEFVERLNRLLLKVAF